MSGFEFGSYVVYIISVSQIDIVC